MAARRLAVLAALLVLVVAFVLAPTQGQTTETPATSAPATEAPATSAPATEAPATSAPATTTPTPTTSAPATTTPTPTTSAPATTTPTPTTTAPASTSPETTTPTPTTTSPATSTPTPTPTNATTPTPTLTPSTCTAPRVRRDWRQLSVDDKNLYRDAIKAAMTTGYHTLFQEILTDKETCNEVYLTSATVYWHRRYLLAYENMLRALEPRFACITIPYWDMFSDYTNQVTNKTDPITNISSPICSSMEQCSTFLGEFGGSSGATTKVSINGFNITTANPDGNCVNGLLSRGRNASEVNNNYADFSNFCESSANNGTCSGCIPRGAWNSTGTLLPPTITTTQLLKVIKPSYGYYYFAYNMMYYFQSPLHNALSSTMATCATAADPMFYSLQATLDLVHQLYYDCQIGTNLTTAQKQSTSSTYMYQPFVLSGVTGVTAPSVMANMTTYWNSTISNQRMRAEDHPLLKQFFAPLTNQYWYYASINDLGNNSYSYSPDTLLTLLAPSLTNCPKNHMRRLAQIQPGSVHAADSTPSPTPSPTPTPNSTPTPSLRSSSSSGSFNGSASNVTSVADSLPDGVILATTDADTRTTTKSVVKDFNYRQAFKALMTSDADAPITEMEVLDAVATADCVSHYAQFKVVDFFSHQYLKDMGLPENWTPFCPQRVKEYEDGAIEIPFDFISLRKELIGMNDIQLAKLPETAVGAAVVPVTAFEVSTTTEVVKPSIDTILDAAVTETSTAAVTDTSTSAV